jgi:integration host factor subunit beta
MENPEGNVPAVLKKVDLVKKVSAAADLTHNEAAVVMDTILDTMMRGLRADGKVEIRRFGSFRMRQRRARAARNPKTGAPVDVPAKKVPYFTPGRELKDGLVAQR